MKTALRDLQADITAGRLEKPACDLVAVFHKAGELSAKFAASTLARSLDILHVAAALTLGARVFVSFDNRRRKIARRARLKVLPRIRPWAVQPRWNAIGFWYLSSSNRAHRRAAELAGQGGDASFHFERAPEIDLTKWWSEYMVYS